MAKFRTGNLTFAWPPTRIDPGNWNITSNTVMSFFSYSGGYSFMTGPNGFNLNVTGTQAYNGLPYWNA